MTERELWRCSSEGCLSDFPDKSLLRGQKLSRRASEERGYKSFLILRRVCWPLSRGSYFR
jgi:hypothetical protein